ncbi:MAG: hypothetical protein L0Z73_08990 [Gammaproteobacteria bacterium]|nr:hypothetical protein [Gammaproteobacteria bacterium]
MYKKILAVGFLLVYSAVAYAQEQGGNAVAYSPLNLHLSTRQYLQLAAAEPAAATATESPAVEKAGTAAEVESVEYKDRWLTANNTHKWLGIGSLVLAAASGLAPKEEDGAHHDLAKGALALGGAAVATGLVFHYDDLSGKNFFSNPDNWHALLTSLAVVGYAVAVDQGGESGHAEAGVAGLVLMAAGIKMTW